MDAIDAAALQYPGEIRAEGTVAPVGEASVKAARIAEIAAMTTMAQRLVCDPCTVR